MTNNLEDVPVEHQMGRVTLTIEANGRKIQRVFEHASIVQESGVELLYHETAIAEPEIRRNGHNRISIQAWSGFKEWDDFVARQERILIE